MTAILAITNQKGGVGKTTTCVNLAASLTKIKHKVLVLDLDPQGNATMGCGVEKNQLTTSAYDLLMHEASVNEIVIEDAVAGFDLLPANADLTAAEVGLIDMDEKEFRLKQALLQLDKNYDYILIDCPPSLSMLTVNSLTAADGIIIPMQCEYYALEGISALLTTIEHVKKNLNPLLRIAGIIRTMYDPRNTLTIDVSNQLVNHFSELVYRTVIPRNIRLAEAPSHGLPALLYDSQSRGAVAYLALASELVRRKS